MKQKVFFSYAREDQAHFEDLLKHLAPLQRKGLIDSWHHRCVEPGGNLLQEIDTHLEEADIIAVLVSSDFLASKYCHDIELARSLARHAERSARVIPIIVRPVDWRSSSLAGLQPLPTAGRPVSRWKDRDDAWVDVVHGIEHLVNPSIAAQPDAMPARQGVKRAEHTPLLHLDGVTYEPEPPRAARSLLQRPAQRRIYAGAALLSVALALAIYYLFSTTTFEANGQVWHTTRNAQVVGAVVALVGCDGTARTNGNGVFALRCKLPRFTHLEEPRVRIKLPASSSYCPYDIPLSRNTNITVIRIDDTCKYEVKPADQPISSEVLTVPSGTPTPPLAGIPSALPSDSEALASARSVGIFDSPPKSSYSAANEAGDRPPAPSLDAGTGATIAPPLGPLVVPTTASTTSSGNAPAVDDFDPNTDLLAGDAGDLQDGPTSCLPKTSWYRGKCCWMPRVPCSRSKQCCGSMLCKQGVCGGPTCRMTGDSCAKDDDCCMQQCVRGMCALQ